MALQFIEDLPLEERLRLAEIRKQRLEEKATIQSKNTSHEYKYRVEQLIMFKVNSIPMDTFQTKTDYQVTKQLKGPQMTVSVEIDDDSFTMFPDKYTGFMNLIQGLEKVKCNALFDVNGQNGRLNKILNYKKVLENWDKFKNDLLAKHDYLRSAETRKAVNTFISESEKVLLQEKALLQELSAKTFFFLFFDKYLITKDNIYSSYQQMFQSQLFSGFNLNLKVSQKILEESPEKVFVERRSEMPKSWDKEQIEERYNKEYKDKIGYKYSNYIADYHAKILFNDTSDDINIEEAELTLTEEIVNNLELIVHHKLRKLK